MTGKELYGIYNQIASLKEQFIEEYLKRLAELSKIAEEKGITEFGYTGPWFDDDDFDGDCEEEMENMRYELQYGAQTFFGYTWKLCDKNVYFTRIQLFWGEDFDGGEDEVDAEMWFDVEAGDNWRACDSLIMDIEAQLGISEE